MSRDHHENMLQLSRGAFEKHQISTRSEGRWLLQRPYKKSPEGWDWTMAAEIICLRSNSIFVGGDIYHVIFGYGPADHLARIRWMGECNDLRYYVHQKASIGMVDTNAVDAFNAIKAEEQLRDIIEQRIENLSEYDTSGKYQDPLGEFLEEDALGYDWPMEEDERDRDDENTGPYHLREFLAGNKTWFRTDEAEIAAYDALKAKLAEHDGFDDMELVEVLKPWLVERKEALVKSEAEKDPAVEAIHEVIRELPDHSSSSTLYSSLHDTLWQAARASGDKGIGYLADEQYDLGKVVAPRVYYAHAALRKLCELLDAEEEKEKTDDR